jgi:hypothetical protein
VRDQLEEFAIVLANMTLLAPASFTALAILYQYWLNILLGACDHGFARGRLLL